MPRLTSRGHAIDVFVDATRVRPQPAPSEPPPAGAWRVIDAHDFVWRQARGHYDLAVYQIGNSHLHRFTWPYLFRYPGLAVLHDARLHHARAEVLIASDRPADYRAEFAFNHPGVDSAAAGFALLGLEGPFFYQWPMVRGVLASAKVTAAHSAGVVAALRRDWPGMTIEHIALGEGAAHLDVARARRAFRSAHTIPADAVVFGAFGALSAEKRVVEILSAFRTIRTWLPNAWLLLAGAADPMLGLSDRLTELRISGAVTRLPAANDAEFDRAIAASDVVLSLRWPTALETSGPWVRALALGRATIVIDLPHQTHVPALDPQTWRRHAPSDDLSPDADAHAVTVALDLRDINHSLRLAMRRLGSDSALRDRLGAAARAWWEREHTVDRMVDDYERVMAQAAGRPRPAPAPDWPPHLTPDPMAPIRRVLDADVWRHAAVSDRLVDLDS